MRIVRNLGANGRALYLSRRGMGGVLLLVALSGLAACARVPEKIDPPSVYLSDLRVVDLKLAEQTFALTLRVQNPNAFEVPIRGLDYSVEMNGEEVARGVSNKPVTLPALGEIYTELPAITSLNTILQQLSSMTRSATFAVNYRIRGTFRVGRGLQGLVPIPFDRRGEFSLDNILKLLPKKPIEPTPAGT